MTGPTEISAALTSIKTALDIAKALKQAGDSLERAELRLRLVDLMSSVADTKWAVPSLVEIQAVSR